MLRLILISGFYIMALEDSVLYAQHYCDYLYDNNWVLGGDDDTIDDKYGGNIMHFLPAFTVDKRRKQSDQSASFAVINSKYGRLLFYSNGCNVYNGYDELMENGDQINPGEIHDDYCTNIFGYPGIHNMFILPSSYDTSIYYLFHFGEIYNRIPNAPILLQFDKLYCTTVDVTANSGHGSVTDKNHIVLLDTSMISQPISAVRHANGLDWWIITPDRWTNGFFTVLLDQFGPHYTGEQFIGLTTHYKASGGQGKFSPDGSRFAWFQPRNGIFLYDFDRENGELYNFRHIEIPYRYSVTGGLEYSPTGRFLYVNNDTSLYQLDLLAEDIQESIVHIGDYDGFRDPFPTSFLFMERTPDKRIIMNVRNGSQWLHVIQEPDKKGTACRFEQHAIKLPTVNNFTLPHFPNYRLGALGDPLCDSLMVSTQDNYNVSSDAYRIVPNPASDYFYLEDRTNNFDFDLNLAVCDLYGQKVLSSVSQNVDISNLAEGIYFVTLQKKNRWIQNLKLVIAR